MAVTCDIDVDCGEGSEGHGGDILSTQTQDEVASGLVVQRLSDQDGGRAVLTVGRQVEAHGHVGLRHHPIFQVISHPGIAQQGGGFDCLQFSDKERRPSKYRLEQPEAQAI